MLRIAYEFAERGTCNRLKVGAVIAESQGRILGHGYNGTLPGFEHCSHVTSGDALDQPCRMAIHAEMNAIANAHRNGVPVQGATLYTTHSPCVECAKAIGAAGISCVYYGTPYRSMMGVGWLSINLIPCHELESDHG